MWSRWIYRLRKNSKINTFIAYSPENLSNPIPSVPCQYFRTCSLVRCATHSISYSPDQTKLRPPRSAEYYVYARKFYPAGSSKTCLPGTNWTWVGSRNSFFFAPTIKYLVRLSAFCDLEVWAVHFTIPFFIAQTSSAGLVIQNSSHLRHGQGAGADLSRPFGPLYYRGPAELSMVRSAINAASPRVAGRRVRFGCVRVRRERG